MAEEHSSKRRKVKSSDQTKSSHDSVITDPRFVSIQSDPRYQLPSKRHTHVKLDKRFSRIFKDEDFSRKSKVDRYGRPLEADAEMQRLKRRYEFEEDDVDDDEEVQVELKAVEKIHDPLREGKSGSSLSKDSSSDEDSELEEEEENIVRDQEDGNIPMGDVTSRIAVVSLDWDNIRAADLMAVFSSFLPTTGRLSKVAIYPSEFGKERMVREEMEGPPKEIFAAHKTEEDSSDTGSEIEEAEDEDEEIIKSSIVKPDDGTEFDSAALRRYQLDRLRYFYAVLTFSSSSAAKAIYDACDGTEYLSTANFFDLRFVPDDTDFSTDNVREECNKIPEGYKPNEFVTDALQHSKVKLTWDAEDVGRKEAQARAFKGGMGRKKIDENDLKAYLGSDSDGEGGKDLSDEDQQPNGDTNDPPLSKKEQERQRVRALLGLAPEPVNKSKKENGPMGDLQITFSSGLNAAPVGRTSVFENEPEIEETTVEKYVRKERERKQKRKEKMKSGRDGENAAVIYAEGTILAEPEAVAEVEAADLGFDDPFFAEPSNDTKTASKQRKADRLKKRAEREREEEVSRAKRAELELLLVDDKEADVRHFDMAEVERAEKMKRKGRNKKAKSKKSENVDGKEDVFMMDTQDPRFASLFENHEFAIDPTNPKFRGTEAMKALLDEGRRRRKGDKSTEGNVERKRDTEQKTEDNVNEVRHLVEKMKKRKDKPKY